MSFGNPKASIFQLVIDNFPSRSVSISFRVDFNSFVRFLDIFFANLTISNVLYLLDCGSLPRISSVGKLFNFLDKTKHDRNITAVSRAAFGEPYAGEF